MFPHEIMTLHTWQFTLFAALASCMLVMFFVFKVYDNTRSWEAIGQGAVSGILLGSLIWLPAWAVLHLASWLIGDVPGYIQTPLFYALYGFLAFSGILFVRGVADAD